MTNFKEDSIYKGDMGVLNIHILKEVLLNRAWMQAMAETMFTQKQEETFKASFLENSKRNTELFEELLKSVFQEEKAE